MSEIARPPILRRTALAHPPLGAPGASLRMSAMTEGHVLQALAAPRAVDITKRLADIGDGGRFAVRVLSPGQWFVMGDAPISTAEFRRKAAEVADVAALSDQSSGRVRIALAGVAAETVLARGTAVDVSLASFPLGHSAQTLFGHIGIHLTRIGDDAFELMALRSFAESLWEELAASGRMHFEAA